MTVGNWKNNLAATSSGHHEQLCCSPFEATQTPTSVLPARRSQHRSCSSGLQQHLLCTSPPITTYCNDPFCLCLRVYYHQWSNSQQPGSAVMTEVAESLMDFHSCAEGSTGEAKSQKCAVQEACLSQASPTQLFLTSSHHH